MFSDAPLLDMSALSPNMFESPFPAPAGFDPSASLESKLEVDLSVLSSNIFELPGWKDGSPSLESKIELDYSSLLSSGLGESPYNPLSSPLFDPPGSQNSFLSASLLEIPRLPKPINYNPSPSLESKVLETPTLSVPSTSQYPLLNDSLKSPEPLIPVTPLRDYGKDTSVIPERFVPIVSSYVEEKKSSWESPFPKPKPVVLKNPYMVGISDYSKPQEENSWESPFPKPKPVTPKPFVSHHDWEGDVWSKSFEPTRTYGKNLPHYGEGIQLHVHETQDGFITGAKLKNVHTDTTFRTLSNYEAAMEDLSPKKSFAKKLLGFLKW